MIIFSRSRTETNFDTELAEAIAARFHAHVLSIPFFYDLRSFGGVVQRLRTLDEPGVFLATFPERASKNLLEHLEVKAITEVMDISNVSLGGIIQFIERLGDKFLNSANSGGRVERLDELTVQRWYPVIDRSECLGCLECVNFCLFGVYVIGGDAKPVTDQPDACRAGCPACARVCPGGAIMFPMHDDPDISGRTDAETVRQKVKTDIFRAEAERRNQTNPNNNQTNPNQLSATGEWDELVEEVDRFDYRQF